MVASVRLSRGDDSTGEAEEMIFFLTTLTGRDVLFCDKLFIIGSFLLTNIFLLLLISAVATKSIITIPTRQDIISNLLFMVVMSTLQSYTIYSLGMSV